MIESHSLVVVNLVWIDVIGVLRRIVGKEHNIERSNRLKVRIHTTGSNVSRQFRIRIGNEKGRKSTSRSCSLQILHLNTVSGSRR